MAVREVGDSFISSFNSKVKQILQSKRERAQNPSRRVWLRELPISCEREG